MSLLSPPAVADRPALRSRASSTSVRPQLSVQSLSPRNRAASLSIVPPSPSHTNKSAIYPSPTSSCDSDHSTVVQIDNSPSDRNSIKQSSSASMVPLLISRVIQLVRALRPGASPKDTAALFVSPPASPRSSTDTEFILPVSSPRKTAFDVVDVSVPVPRVRFGMTLRVPSVSPVPRVCHTLSLTFLFLPFFFLLSLSLSIGSCAGLVRHSELPALNWPHVVLFVNASRHGSLASYSRRSRKGRSGSQCVRPVRHLADFTHSRSPVRIGRLETCLLYPR